MPETSGVLILENVSGIRTTNCYNSDDITKSIIVALEANKY